MNMPSKITKNDLHEWWSKNETIRYKSVIYRIGKMSYGDYFLEPRTWKGGEKDGHSPQTRFFYLKDARAQIYGVGDELGE